MLIRGQGLIHIEDFLHGDALKTLLSVCLSTDPEKTWIKHSINLFIQSIITQKDPILKEIGILDYSKGIIGKKNEEKLTLSQKENGEQPGPSSGGATKAYTDHLKKFEQLKAMKESMNKKFFEATENKHLMENKSNSDMMNMNTNDKYSELGGATIQCNVIHPCAHGFHRILEVNMLKIQRQLWNQKCELINDEDHIMALSRQRIQKLWIPNSIQYGAQVMCMKASTMAFACNVFIELLEDRELERQHCEEEIVNVQTMQQLLFLLEMISQHHVHIDESVMKKLCDTSLNLITSLSFSRSSSSLTSAGSVSSSVNTLHKYLLKKISLVLLNVPSLSASTFSLRLFQADIKHRQQNALASNSGGESEMNTGLANFHFLSLEKLCSTTELTEEERILLKELLFMICDMQ